MGETDITSLADQFKQAVDKLKRNKEIRESGKFLCLPYPFPRLAEVLPGIDRGQHIGLTAGTGISRYFVVPAKLGELLETPVEANQQPNLSRNTLGGSTTNSIPQEL